MSIEIQLDLNKKFVRILQQIKKNAHLYPELLQSHQAISKDKKKISLEKLIQLFDELCKLTQDKRIKNDELLLIEQYKLIILENFYNNLNTSYSQKKQK